MSGTLVLALRILVAISLYAFLAWAFISLWRELRQQSALLASQKYPPISLNVLFPEKESKVFHFSQPEVSIGRDPNNECHLENDTVSSRHALLRYHHNHWWIEDLGSKNGTWLNEERLDCATVVVPGDQVKVGSILLLVSISGQLEFPENEKAKNG